MVISADLAAQWLTNGMLVAGPITLVAGVVLHRLAGIAAPYGRFAAKTNSRGWGPLLNGRLAWVTQELPSLLVPLLVAWRAGLPLLPDPSSPCGALAAAFLVHYTYRSLVYPLRLRAPKGTALVVWAMAAAFCCWNGFIQGHFLYHQCPIQQQQQQQQQQWRARHVAGLCLWLSGWLLNLQSDGILRRLRSGPNDTGYKIPRGGLFEYVSAANYTAECLEWTGWALAAWSASAAAFAVFTFSNLAPRAVAHHQWYREKYGEEYPRSRRAIIPLLW